MATAISAGRRSTTMALKSRVWTILKAKSVNVSNFNHSAPRLISTAVISSPSFPTITSRYFQTSTTARETYPVLLPALSPTMTEGTIVKWLVKEGDEVAVGDTLFEMETDKAIMAVESTEDGYMSKILLEEGTSGISINSLVALMVEEEGEVPEMPDVEQQEPQEQSPTTSTTSSSSSPSPSTSSTTPPPPPSPSPSTSSTTSSMARGKSAKPLSPAVLALVNKEGLDVSLIPATGPKGHILKGDVLAFLAGESVAVSKAQPKDSANLTSTSAKPSIKEETTFTDIPTTNIRKVIARRLTESKSTIPHAYASVDVNMTALTKIRTDSLETSGVKFSFNDAIIKSAALALRTMPSVNSSFRDGVVEPLTSVDISVAVATPTGLITPIVTSADGRGLVDISTTVKDLAGKAREGKLQPHEYQGGTFSVSNLGMMGISSFSAVINPPQACILAVGATKPKINSDFTVSQVATFTLSADARVCDDEQASQWLQKFKAFMENPATLL